MFQFKNSDQLSLMPAYIKRDFITKLIVMADEHTPIDWEYHRSVINKFGAVPDDEWLFLKSILLVKSKAKGEHLLKEGEVCNYLFYIISGGARLYFISDAGIEVTYNFIFENNFVVAFTSLFTRTPTNENIILLEDTVMFTLSRANFQTLLNRHPVWESILNKLLAKHFLKIREKEQMLLLDNYDMRYKRLLKEQPYLFQRVEQRYLASYLGMKPETFSRIKKRVYQNKK